ncbi:L-rhamnose 1-dehydrogenase (NADP(+)) [uncultured archaeon]|nr:L-rhamnose 1-dehydrogenase (NADP(+)) [uncultured archaeon]
MYLKGKVAIITGAASGIGRATAILFAQEGAKVVVTDINNTGGLETVRIIKKRKKQALFVHADVSKESDVKTMVKTVKEAHKKVDILVNNAGIVLVKPIMETTEQDFETVVNTNYKSVFLCTKHVLPYMKKGGTIVNVASISGHVGQINHAVYGGTKGAIIALTRALAWELAPRGIRVNTISPGSVETPMLLGDVQIEAKRLGVSMDKIKKERSDIGALHRWADPKEIAEAILYLASDKSSYVTGTDLLVDAGWAAG